MLDVIRLITDKKAYNTGHVSVPPAVCPCHNSVCNSDTLLCPLLAYVDVHIFSSILFFQFYFVVDTLARSCAVLHQGKISWADYICAQNIGFLEPCEWCHYFDHVIKHSVTWQPVRERRGRRQTERCTIGPLYTSGLRPLSLMLQTRWLTTSPLWKLWSHSPLWITVMLSKEMGFVAFV